jgi:hypothetical protein
MVAPIASGALDVGKNLLYKELKHRTGIDIGPAAFQQI